MGLQGKGRSAVLAQQFIPVAFFLSLHQILSLQNLCKPQRILQRRPTVPLDRLGDTFLTHARPRRKQF